MCKKIKIVSIVLVLNMSLLVTGQTFKGGILGGVSASQVDGDSYAGYDKVGLQGGVFVNTFFSEKFGVQMEIKYTGRGARKKTSEEDPLVYKLSLHYIDIPLMMNFVAQRKFIFEAGIVPGYLFALSGDDSGGRLDGEFLSDFKKFDLSWLLGFRYQFADNLSAGIRYSYSLFSILEDTGTNSSYSVIGKLFGYSTGDYNNYITMGIYYQIR